MIRINYSKTIYSFILVMTFSLLFSCQETKKTNNETTQPNIIILYVDDLGFGDVGSYGALGVETPNIDKLANGGVKFTDAHSAAATCTPSRYSLLTGEYAFRNSAEILPGDAPLIISPEMPTLPKMLKGAGYTTSVIGKWHLGLGQGKVDWNVPVKPGPLEVGFDYAFLIPSTGDRVPTVYLENHNVVNIDANDPIRVSYQDTIGSRPTGISNPELLRQAADPQHSNTIINGISRIGYMEGGESALWTDEEFPEILTNKAFQFIEDNKEDPFFLFYSFHDIHVPRLPHPRFQGRSGMGPRGDAIVQVDWVTGQITQKLEEMGLAENTLIIFTSDNGPVLNDGYEDQAIEKLGKHRPSGIYRGGKYSIYEAGTRVPTIFYWPGKIQSMESNALINQVDFYASIAKLLDIDPKIDEAKDSENLLPALLGETTEGRKEMIKESFFGLALRQGEWKYIEPSKFVPEFTERKGIESGASKKSQLYNLSVDPSEQENLVDDYPEKVASMRERLETIKKQNKGQ